MPKTPFQRDVLKLAKAMEQGIQKTKKTTGDYVTQKELASGKKSNVVYACALGAAWVNGYSLKRSMAGPTDGTTVQNALSARYPTLSNAGIFDEVVNRNDRDNWSRGRIAAWLRRVAAKYAEPPSNYDEA